MELEVVATTTDEAPGTGGERFGSFGFPAFSGGPSLSGGAPVLNAHGDLAFPANITGTGLGDPFLNGIWRRSQGGVLEAVAYEPAPLPGFEPDRPSLLINPPNLNDAGDIHFGAFLDGDPPADLTSAIFRFGGAGNAPVLREGDPLGGDFTFVEAAFDDTPIANEAGQLAFVASVADASGAGGTALVGPDGAGGLSPLAFAGGPAPGTQGLELSIPRALSLTNSGRVAFHSEAGVPGGGFRDPVLPGIWQTDDAGELGLVVLAGDEAPGTEPGSTFFEVGEPHQNALGELGFAGFTGESFSEFRYGFWRTDANGVISKVIYEGDPAPGLPGLTARVKMTTATNHRGRASLNDAGQFAFRTQLVGDGVETTVGVYVQDRDGTFDLRLRSGEPVGDIAEALSISSLDSPVITESGALIAFGAVAGDGVDSRNNDVLLYQDPNGLTRIVIRQGQVLEVGPGDERTVDAVVLGAGIGLTDNLGFNDRGELAFRVLFTDRSEAIVFATIPEPATGVMAALALAALAAQRRGGRLRDRRR